MARGKYEKKPEPKFKKASSGTNKTNKILLRVMVVLYMTPPETPRLDAVNHWGQKVGGIMVLLAALAVLVVGVYPDPVIAISKYAFFAISPELQQFIFTLVQSGFN